MRKYLIRQKRQPYRANVVHLFLEEKQSAVCQPIIKPGKTWRVITDVKELMICDSCQKKYNPIGEEV